LSAFDQMRKLNPSANTADMGDAQVFIAQHEYDKAVEALLRRLEPSAINYYWLAAAYSGKGDKTKTLATLQKAFDLGFRDFGALDNTEAFASLRSDPQYQSMLSKYRK